MSPIPAAASFAAAMPSAALEGTAAEGMSTHTDEMPDTSSVGVESAVGLAANAKTDEERFLGLALAVQHGPAFAQDAALRSRLLAAVDAKFIGRLLHSQLALRRVALVCCRVLAADEAGAEKLYSCAHPLVDACTAAFKQKLEAKEPASGGDHEGEVLEAFEALKQLLRFATSPEALAHIAAAVEALMSLLAPPRGDAALMRVVGSELPIATAVLALVQELGVALVAAPTAVNVPTSAVSLVQALCVEAALQNTPVQALALGLLVEQVEAGAVCDAERLDEALGAAFSAGEAGRVPSLRLAAACLGRYGITFGLKDKVPRFGRLKPLLSLATGELRIGLEGHSSLDRLCAACMTLEAAIVALGEDADLVEASGHLQDAADCLRHIHRAVGDVYEYSADLSVDSAPPPELALLARVAAAWQLEDPRQFSVEFQRSLPRFCQLSWEEFKVLLPCVHQAPDWHLGPAFGKVLECAFACLEANAADSREVFRQCVLMLTEVALDAAAYLPEAPFPDAPDLGVPDANAQVEDSSICSGGAAVWVPINLPQLPRPLQAADAEHPGVRRLCAWSHALWVQGVRSLGSSTAEDSALLWGLGNLCGALLTSVPEAAVSRRAVPPVSSTATTASSECVPPSLWPDGVWVAVADCLLSGRQVDASTWRLALRLAGFVLDRHRGIAVALHARAAVAGVELRPPAGALPETVGGNDEDEWAIADQAASVAVRQCLEEVAHRRPKQQALAASGKDAAIFDEMD